MKTFRRIEIGISVASFILLLLFPQHMATRIVAMCCCGFIVWRRMLPAKKTDVHSGININTLPDAVIISDLNGLILNTNKHAIELFREHESLSTMSQLFDTWHTRLCDRTSADEVVSAALTAPGFQFSERLELLDGKTYERITRLAHERSVRVWILRDITHLKKAQSDNVMHNSLLEADAARMAELAEQLYHAKAELEANQAELTRLANTDSLTGLFNRRRFTSMGEECIQKTASNKVWVIMMDIDHFKSINDTYGHGAGDMAIRDIASIISDTIGDKGFVGRMGGEEFAAILEDVELDDTIRIAERIRKTTAEHITVHESEKFRFTVSIGVAQWLPGEITIEAAIDRSDQALYSAKTFGRNRVVGYETGQAA